MLKSFMETRLLSFDYSGPHFLERFCDDVSILVTGSWVNSRTHKEALSKAKIRLKNEFNTKDLEWDSKKNALQKKVIVVMKRFKRGTYRYIPPSTPPWSVQRQQIEYLLYQWTKLDKTKYPYKDEYARNDDQEGKQYGTVSSGFIDKSGNLVTVPNPSYSKKKKEQDLIDEAYIPLVETFKWRPKQLQTRYDALVGGGLEDEDKSFVKYTNQYLTPYTPEQWAEQFDRENQYTDNLVKSWNVKDAELYMVVEPMVFDHNYIWDSLWYDTSGQGGEAPMWVVLRRMGYKKQDRPKISCTDMIRASVRVRERGAKTSDMKAHPTIQIAGTGEVAGIPIHLFFDWGGDDCMALSVEVADKSLPEIMLNRLRFVDGRHNVWHPGNAEWNDGGGACKGVSDLTQWKVYFDEMKKAKAILPHYLYVPFTHYGLLNHRRL